MIAAAKRGDEQAVRTLLAKGDRINVSHERLGKQLGATDCV